MATTAEQVHSEGIELEPHTPTLYGEHLFSIGEFPVTNSLLTSWIAVLILVALAILIRKKIRTIPRGIQNATEIVINGALDLCDQVTGDSKLSRQIFPVTFTVFFFVLINNWLGLIPGVGSIGKVVSENGHQVLIPFLRGGTADINTTLALAIISVIGANIFGAFSIGLWKTFNKYVNIKILGQIFTKVKKEPTILFVAPITFFVGLIEAVGEAAKIASLSFRLFGNIFAGEVLLASMAAIFAFATPIPFIFLEVIVGIIQALIFAMLTLVYFTIASHDHEHDEHEGGETEPHAELVEEGVVAEGKMTS